MHETLFLIQIFQYFCQILPRVSTLVLFILMVLLLNGSTIFLLFGFYVCMRILGLYIVLMRSTLLHCLHNTTSILLEDATTLGEQTSVVNRWFYIGVLSIQYVCINN